MESVIDATEHNTHLDKRFLDDAAIPSIVNQRMCACVSHRAAERHDRELDL